MGAVITKATPALDDLARRINAEHDAALKSFGNALDHARAAGQLLVDAKAKQPHGSFLSWVEGHCQFSERTARTYMRIAREWTKLEPKRQSVADLSIAKAVELIAPKPLKPKIIAGQPPPKAPRTIDVKAWEIVAIAPTERPEPFSSMHSSRRYEPTPEVKAADKLRADLVERLGDVIRSWRRDHSEATDDLVYEALEDLKNGAADLEP
jgi:hypothetical protein